MQDNISWDCQYLNEVTQEWIHVMNQKTEKDEINSIYNNLIQQARTVNQLGKEYLCGHLSPCELNDYSSEEESWAKQNYEERCSTHIEAYKFDRREGQNVSLESNNPATDYSDDSTAKGKKLCWTIQNDPENIQQIINLMSNMPDSQLIVLLNVAWQGISTEKEQCQFIAAISSNTTAASLFCRHILIHWFSTKYSDESVEMIKVSVKWFGHCVVTDLIVPLLQMEENLFIQDIHKLKEILCLLNYDQTILLIRNFIDAVSSDLRQWHLAILAAIIENTYPSNSEMETMLTLLEANMDNFIEDRSMGQLLLLLLKGLTEHTPQSIIKRIISLANKYKGLLRFKFRKLLKVIPKGS